MSTDLITDMELNETAQYVKDQEGNISSLSLSKEGNVGIGTSVPETKLDINGTLKLKASALGKALFFADSDFSLGATQGGFRLENGGWRIFEVTGKNRLFFDNVDVYPDNDKQQSLGLETNQWATLYVVDVSCSGGLSLTNLENAPPGTETVDLVADKRTGKIYRKN